MDSRLYFLRILVLSLSIGPLCKCQTGPSITQPKLTSVIPINSTALTVNWAFAAASIDQSDLIRIYIVFYEYFYSYSATYASNNYTFTSANKTITSLTKNFDLVNAYYYVCFSSNSTVTNVSVFLSIVNNCTLTRTCLRSNAACPGPSSVTILASSISSNSFTISYFWPIDLPYSSNSFNAQLINNGQIGVSTGSAQNTTYTIRSYQFTGLQPLTTYTVNASFSYSILTTAAQTNITIFSVKTSYSSKLSHTRDLISFCFSFSVISFYMKTS
ncbi:unnamed protein product [Rotaria magnacalcarata]|uniref:Fibronectin type-III domain-containing protein n=2 Tax=Rotaria magnacalcarata TaxID=392030 RepID=A0A819AB48_9BILA|nr:unnamed protein product [Rotaria magnacalcarata]CAF2118939.1 unnamed protein product [Rotaria magnacalcarata]CAF3779373.1 unnamed protein product [Rotaria magnacalcarata]CAF3922439.1 unnamed protein product [Rotaria magnacalcarata]